MQQKYRRGRYYLIERSSIPSERFYCHSFIDEPGNSKSILGLYLKKCCGEDHVALWHVIPGEG
jgi:hypothetical protein